LARNVAAVSESSPLQSAAIESSLVEEQHPIEQKPQVTMAAQRKSIDCRNYPGELPPSGSKYSNESDQRHNATPRVDDLHSV
jgi:hypothetical protein